MPYKTPQLPSTPSTTINNHLQARFGEAPDNLFKSIIAHYVCAIFYSITIVYKSFHRKGSLVSPARESFSTWTLSCSLVSLTISIACYLAYRIIIATSFLVKGAIAYGFTGLAILAVLTGIYGSVFFDRVSRREAKRVADQASKEAEQADQTLGYDQPSLLQTDSSVDKSD